MLLHVIFFGFCWFDLCTASNVTLKHPGIVIRLSAACLTTFGELGSKYIMAEYARGEMIDITDAERCLFDICSLLNIVTDNYVSPTSTVDIRPGIGMELRLMDASFLINADIEVQKVDEYVKGRVQVTLSDISLAAMFKLDRGMDDRLVVSLSHCSVDIGSVYSYMIDASDEDSPDRSRSDFYKTMSTYFEERVYESVRMTMCNKTRFITEIISNYFSWVDSKLGSLGLTMDSRLVRIPIVEFDNVEVAVSGEICLPNDKEGVIGLMHSPLPEPPSSESSMVFIRVSSLVFNSLMDALFRSNWFSVNVTKESFPLKYEYCNFLETTCENVCLGTILPYVAKKYPNVSATLVIEASKRPSAKISRRFAKLCTEFRLSIVLPGVNGSEEPVANMSMSVCIWITAFISDNKVEGRFDNLEVFITDEGSPKEFASHLSRVQYVVQMIADLIVLQLNYARVGIHLEKLFGLGIRFVRHDLRPITDAFVFKADFYDTPLV